jgi:hypothetical protein
MQSALREFDRRRASFGHVLHQARSTRSIDLTGLS